MNHPNETPKLQTVSEGLNSTADEKKKKIHAVFVQLASPHFIKVEFQEVGVHPVLDAYIGAVRK